MPAFRVKLGSNDLNCVDVPLNPTHSLTQCVMAIELLKNEILVIWQLAFLDLAEVWTPLSAVCFLMLFLLWRMILAHNRLPSRGYGLIICYV